MLISNWQNRMPFPHSERVIYSRNPLEVVIAQIRFPPLLSIEAEVPARFQERIRHQYPLFSEPSPFGAGLQIPLDVMRLVRPAFNATRNYQFASENDQWTLTLSKESMALACNSYRQWEEFRSHFSPSTHALVEQYSPSFLTRIGLRYRNVIRRSALGLDGVPWSQLLEPRIAAELDSPISEDVEESNHQILVELSDIGGKVRIFHGIVKAADGEPCYVIDNDFFSEEKMEIRDAESKLDDFNRKSGSLFRWCIKDQLHESLGPRVMEPQHH